MRMETISVFKDEIRSIDNVLLKSSPKTLNHRLLALEGAHRIILSVTMLAKKVLVV